MLTTRELAELGRRLTFASALQQPYAITDYVTELKFLQADELFFRNTTVTKTAWHKFIGDRIILLIF